MVIEKSLQRSHTRPAGFLLGFALVVLAATALADNWDYRLYAGDSISISVYPYLELSGVFVLDERGHFKLPLAEPIPGSGKTTEELRNLITERLKERVDGELEVSVSVVKLPASVYRR